jgi:hypothetical protein
LLDSDSFFANKVESDGEQKCGDGCFAADALKHRLADADLAARAEHDHIAIRILGAKD